MSDGEKNKILTWSVLFSLYLLRLMGRSFSFDQLRMDPTSMEIPD